MPPTPQATCCTLPNVFALLDDALARDGQQPAASRLYTGYQHSHVCHDPAQLDACWAAASADLARGLHAVLLADYEWGARLQGAGLPVAPGASLRLLMFSQLQRLDEAGVQAFLRQADAGRETPSPAGTLALRASDGPAAFGVAVESIREAIRCGEVYQVNYTDRLLG